MEKFRKPRQTETDEAVEIELSEEESRVRTGDPVVQVIEAVGADDTRHEPARTGWTP